MDDARLSLPLTTAPAVADCDHSFAGKLFEGAPHSRDWQPMLGSHLTHRQQLLT